jgi:hypothetical protein
MGKEISENLEQKRTGWQILEGGPWGEMGAVTYVLSCSGIVQPKEIKDIIYRYVKHSEEELKPKRMLRPIGEVCEE